jgi:mono/diheme cytochrome c family protein
MKIWLTLVLAVVLIFAAALIGLVAYARFTGLSARGEPAPIEATVARFVRSFAIPSAVKARRSPFPPSSTSVAAGLAHFADHCAVCHANDGSGNAEMGRGQWPKAPDMRRPATQNLSDGELFFIIENGIRFTGMPAWSTGDAAGETATWQLVHFIRRLPTLTQAQLTEMESLNPRSPEEIRQEIAEEEFLNGGGDPQPATKDAP